MTLHTDVTKTLNWADADPELAATLPSRYFYDGKIFEAEQRRIFMKSWHLACHVSELAEPGSYIVENVFDQSVVVLKDNEGGIRAFHNVCQHRGNRLLEARRGRLGSMIRCGYHAWCYGLDGALRHAPRAERLKDFDRTAIGLKPVRLETLGGFAFFNLDPHAAPLAEMAAGAEAEMRRFLPDLDHLRLIEEVDVVVPANWKVIMDNSIEGYHFDLSGSAHRHLVGLIDFKKYALVEHGNWWTYMAPPKPGANSAYGEALEGATYQTDWFFNIGIWPNTTLYCFPYADVVGTFIMIPLEPEKSLLRFGYYAPSTRELPAVSRACMRWMNKELGPEDIQLNVTVQKGLRSLGYDQGRYLIDAERSNESEHLVHHFHRLVYNAVQPEL